MDNTLLPQQMIDEWCSKYISTKPGTKFEIITPEILLLKNKILNIITPNIGIHKNINEFLAFNICQGIRQTGKFKGKRCIYKKSKNKKTNVLDRIVKGRFCKNHSMDIFKFPNGKIDYNKSMEYHKLRVRQEDLTRYGYIKTEIIQNIQYYLSKNEAVYGRNNKLNVVKELYSYLAKPMCIIFINWDDNIVFKNTLTNKLIDFYNNDNVKEAKIWYYNIFKEEMPLQKIK